MTDALPSINGRMLSVSMYGWESKAMTFVARGMHLRDPPMYSPANVPQTQGRREQLL